jgi:ribonuclease D
MLAAIQKRMTVDYNLWKRRPLAQELLQYAAVDVGQLLPLAEALTVDLGESQLSLLRRLSEANFQRSWLASDRTCPQNPCDMSALVSLSPFAPGSWLGQLFIMATES